MLIIHPSIILGGGGLLIAFVLLLTILDKLKSLPIAICLFLLVIVLTAIVLVLTHQYYQERYVRNKEARKAARKALEMKLDSLKCSGCSEECGLAARYEGWDGSIHTFIFSSDDFAAMVRNANPKKCLG